MLQASRRFARPALYANPAPRPIGQAKLTSTFTIAHLTDPHLPPAPWPPRGELAVKRVLGFLNWKRGRERWTDAAMLGRLVADIRAQGPDHVAMTGDIANLALEGEFAAGAEWLKTLGPPAAVSFVPGNHDAYVAQALPSLDAVFAPWTAGDAAREDAERFPYLRVRGNVAVIGVNSGVPTALFMATGKVGDAQLGRLRALLADCRARCLARIVLIHHAPAPGLARMRRMTDAEGLMKVLSEEGAELALHGHHHKRMLSFIPSARTRLRGGAIPVIGAPSASTLLQDERRRAAYHLARLETDGDAMYIAVTARGPGDGGVGIVELAKLL